jgi:hypothetical protein
MGIGKNVRMSRRRPRVPSPVPSVIAGRRNERSPSPPSQVEEKVGAKKRERQISDERLDSLVDSKVARMRPSDLSSNLVRVASQSQYVGCVLSTVCNMLSPVRSLLLFVFWLR